MTALYSHQGQEPQELPERIRLSDGRSRTDSSTFTEEELANAGFTGPYNYPEYDDNYHESVSWNSELKQWDIIPLPEKFFWDRLKNRRNNTLANSDWTQLPDAPITSEEKVAWAKYRQELRDIPSKIENIRDSAGKNMSSIFQLHCPSDPDLASIEE
jgi:hypothetical protein